jgi:alpha-tubulin suppressor-like RCC1 family protein
MKKFTNLSLAICLLFACLHSYATICYVKPVCSAALVNSQNEFCMGSADLPFNLTNYYGPGTTAGGTWTTIGPDFGAVSGTTFNPIWYGIFELTYTVNDGVCTDSETISVTVYPELNAWVLSELTVCLDENVPIDLLELLYATATIGGVFQVLSTTGIASVSISGTNLSYTVLAGSVEPLSIDVEYTVTSFSTTYPCSTISGFSTILIYYCLDCLGIPNGFALPGTACDDGNPNTFNDGYDSNCICSGTCSYTSNTTTISTCDSYTWVVNGTTYTSSGTYTSVSGCHTEILVLTITSNTSNTTTISACDSYTWGVNGTTYTSSGTYTSVSGCHTENLVLTISLCFTGLKNTYCSTDPPDLLTGSQAPDGIFSGPGITDHGNGTATFDPATAGNGGTITYSATVGETWASVSAGSDFTLAIKPDGTLWAWGSNIYGKLGIGNSMDYNTPVQVGTANTWASVSAGGYHSIAQKTDGTFWAWGKNDFGQLGIGNNTNQNSPVQIPNSYNWVSVSAGVEYTVALKNDGSLWAWGNNGYGQLGNGNLNNQNNPVQVGTANNWESVSVGFFHTLALKTDGTLWAWGRNDLGQLGIGNNTDQNSPVQVGIDNNWASVKVGFFHSLGIKEDGTLWAWGNNTGGQLGVGNNTDHNTPVQVGIDNNWAIIAGGNHILAIKTDGTLWACGYNGLGQLGIGNNIDQNSLVQVGTDNNWLSVSAKGAFTLARRTDNTLWAWGYNLYGQLGIGNNTNKNDPVLLGTLVTVSQVTTVTPSTSNTTTISACNSYTWGVNGTTYTASGTYSYVSGCHTEILVLTITLNFTGLSNTYCSNDAPVTLMGCAAPLGNFSGPGITDHGNGTATFNPGTAGNGGTITYSIGEMWSSVSAGGVHTIAIKPNGTLWAWGWNGHGQLGIGNTTNQINPIQVGTDNDWASISAGGVHTLALKNDGTLWAWGRNFFGQLGIGEYHQSN